MQAIKSAIIIYFFEMVTFSWNHDFHFQASCNYAEIIIIIKNPKTQPQLKIEIKKNQKPNQKWD